MEIGFFGDSLTEGRIGASYVDLIQNKMPETKLLNIGRGGETVISLHHRIKDMDVTWDMAVVWIGVNDILVHVKWYFSLLKKMQKQPCAKGREDFMGYYGKILDNVGKGERLILTVPPLFIGEDQNNPWNQLLDQLNGEIKRISASRKNVQFVNLRKVFLDRLKDQKLSGYYLRGAGRVLLDYIFHRSPEDFDKLSEERGLFYTLDGIHLNTNGAGLAADILTEELLSLK